MDIYDRQKTLNINTDLTVSVIGCGGIGFWVSKFLAMSGVNNLYIYDPDIIEVSNLNRLDVPESFLGRNKVDVVKLIINSIRPMASVISFPFKYSKFTAEKTDWVIDCTDNVDTQIVNQEIADSLGSRYVKAGYDGTRVSISDRVGEWGESSGGYTIIPSWVCPAVVVATLVVAKVLKYENKELSTDISKLYIV